MPVVKTSAKGQLVIPAEIREAIGLRPGGKVVVNLDEAGKVIVEPLPEDAIESSCGMLRPGRSLTRTLLKERREDRAREQKKIARLLRNSRLPEQRKRFRKG